ncbi:uncharacterized protein LOC128230903 [Mya arenaria]|uniref:uncharacterized protein LOC128230903 n=1 Tax=Mya arenaria TaxID=6604 RepID=UPI0022E7199C|nr:uncharacterized protein LOC128230903 [Mya arenaria]
MNEAPANDWSESGRTSSDDINVRSNDAMDMDELKRELCEMNRKFEVVAFHLKFTKAEHSEVLAQKEARIKQLERDLAASAPEVVEDEMDTLRIKIGHLKKNVGNLEKERDILFHASKRKQSEIQALNAQIETLNAELIVARALLDKKDPEINSHVQDKATLMRRLEENTKQTAESNTNMATIQKQLKLQHSNDSMYVRREIQAADQTKAGRMDRRLQEAVGPETKEQKQIVFNGEGVGAAKSRDSRNLTKPRLSGIQKKRP